MTERSALSRLQRERERVRGRQTTRWTGWRGARTGPEELHVEAETHEIRRRGDRQSKRRRTRRTARTPDGQDRIHPRLRAIERYRRREGAAGPQGAGRT